MRCNIKPFFLTMSFFILFISCYEPFFERLPVEPGYWYLEPMGIPLFVNLDEDFNISEQETDKTAVFIDGNPTAESVVVLAETSPDDFDDAVRIVNIETNTVISMFFHKDQRFPWMIDVINNEKQITAKLSGYDWGYQRYSIIFEEDGGEGIIIEDVKLDRDIMLNYTFNSSLSNDNNIRLRNINTAIGIYKSISCTFPKNESIISNNSTSIDNILSSAFLDIAISAYVITVMPVKPVIYGAIINPLSALGNLINDIANIFKPKGSPSPPPPPPPSPPPLSVAITKDGIHVNSDAVYYLEHEEEIVFDFVFYNFTDYTNVTIAHYEPTMRIYDDRNTYFYSFTQADGSALGKFSSNYSIKIKRNQRTGTGYNKGTTDLVIFFGQNTAINGSNDGISFWEPNMIESAIYHSIFVIHLSVIEPVKE